jgi:hypothetical protein
MSFVNEANLNAALESFFTDAKNRITCPTETEMYHIERAFGAEPYWYELTRSERFESTLRNGLLYRPAIVDDIVKKVGEALDARVRKGIMVKGPQGIGKSHSLVNVVLNLESTGDYLVTFIPDCEVWRTPHYLVRQICASFGSTPEHLGIDFWGEQFAFEGAWEDTLGNIVEAIDAALEKLEKRWVFVFDQINRLFAMPVNEKSKDAATLTFPFNWIAQVRRSRRITSIISASANNEISYKDRHEGFDPYLHASSMNDDELRATFVFTRESMRHVESTSDDEPMTDNEPMSDDKQMLELKHWTGGVPLYVSHFLQKTDEGYEQEIFSSVEDSLLRLQQRYKIQLPAVWAQILDSIFSCLLGTVTLSEFYDKKFFLQDEMEDVRYQYRPLFPTVLTACRSLLWDDLMTYIENV